MVGADFRVEVQVAVGKRNRLSPDEHQAVLERIKSIEARTRGEVLIAIAQQSDRYSSASWRGGMSISLLISVLVWIAVPSIHALVLLAVQSAMLVLFIGGFYWLPFLKRPFLSSSEVGEEIWQRAFEVFFRGGLHHTQDRTGVLIYLSLLERRIVILGDQAVHQKMGNQGWDEAVSAMVLHLKGGNLSLALNEGLAKLGTILEVHFPRAPGEKNPNELPDHLVYLDEVGLLAP